MILTPFDSNVSRCFFAEKYPNNRKTLLIIKNIWYNINVDSLEVEL